MFNPNINRSLNPNLKPKPDLKAPVTLYSIENTEHLAMLYDWRYIHGVLGIVTKNETMLAESRLESDPDDFKMKREAHMASFASKAKTVATDKDGSTTGKVRRWAPFSLRV